MAPEQVKRLYAKLGPRISQVYTLSESAVVTTMLTVEDHELDGSAEREGRLSSCGREVLDVELRIVGDTMNELPPHEVGEIAIRSPGNMMGYWQQPALTQRTLRDGWVLTGDLGRKDEAGYVFLVDRKDDKIITGGFNVYPREVEEILYRHDAVREAAVVGVPDERWGEAIIAVVALYPGKACSDIDLIEFCSQHLAGYKKPKRIVIQDDLPKSPVGKILRRAVREPFWEGKTRRIN
jgi:acyl-CoA synthetase (AMP-forming)/AMP-acid ligase II